MSFANNNDVMTADEVAALFRVNRKTIYDAYNRGDLPGVRIGRLLRFHREAVMKRLKGNVVFRAPQGVSNERRRD